MFTVVLFITAQIGHRPGIHQSDKEPAAYSYNRLLLNSNQEQTTDGFSNMDESQKHFKLYGTY